jgi:hypothetical protein
MALHQHTASYMARLGSGVDLNSIIGVGCGLDRISLDKAFCLS